MLLGVPAYTAEYAAAAKAAEAKAAEKNADAQAAAEEEDEEDEDEMELTPTSKADVGQGMVGCYVPLARTATSDERGNSNWKLEKEFVEGA